MEIQDWTVWLSGAAGVLTAIVATFYRLTRTTRARLHDTVALAQKAMIGVAGRPAILRPEDGVEVAPAIPGLLERTSGIEERQDKALVHLAMMSVQVKTIEHEMQHNGGGSIKDAVKRIEDRLKEGDSRFDRIEVSFATLAEAQTDMWQAIKAVAESRPPEEETLR